jgi:hypothetical protein
MALWGWGLYRVNNIYLDVTGKERPQRQPRWLESAAKPSGDRRELMLLDVMMVVSVLLALIVVAIWFWCLPAHRPASPSRARSRAVALRATVRSRPRVASSITEGLSSYAPGGPGD